MVGDVGIKAESSNLALDVNLGEGCSSGGLKELSGNARLEEDGAIAALFQQVLGFLGDEELDGVIVGVKVELLGDEAERNRWLVTV